MPRAALAAVCALAALAGCGGGDKPGEPLPASRASMELESPAFHQGGPIPRMYTCDGDGRSPPLRWHGVPRGTRELALLVEDPDADGFVHWNLLAIPPDTTTLAAGRVPRGAVQTENSFGKREWGAPCPPEGKGTHRYVFAIYALSRRLGLSPEASVDDVRSEVAGAALARGTLTGRYGR